MNFKHFILVVGLIWWGVAKASCSEVLCPQGQVLSNTGALGESSCVDPEAKDTCSQLKCLSGLMILDSAVQATQPLQENKYIELVESSTPTVSSTATHARIWLNSSDGDLKVIFGNGTVKTLATN